MPFPDIFEQTVLTELIRREWNAIAQDPGGGLQPGQFDGATILPLVRQDGRHIKIRVQEILPYGMAQFRAPHASPALWTPRPTLREEVVEIVDVDEMSRIDPVKVLQLKSPDPNVLKEAVINVTDLGVGLQQRNELRTEWMRWQALQGVLVVDYPDDASITINYGIPGGNFANSGVDWDTTATADPVADLDAFGAVALPNAGIYLPHFHMHTLTFRTMRRATKIRDMLSSYGRSTFLPTEGDIIDLLRPDAKFTYVDSGYLPEHASNKILTNFLPEGKVMATTPNYQYAGRRIGDMADGWVLLKDPGAREPTAAQGMQSEIFSTVVPPYHMVLRQTAARIPRLYASEAIAWLDAYTPA